MRVLTQPPSAPLVPFVKAFTMVEAEEETLRTLLPDTGLVLGLRYRGAARHQDGPPGPLPDATLVGVRGAVRHMLTAAGSGIVLAHFRPGMASALVPGPLHALFGLTERPAPPPSTWLACAGCGTPSSCIAGV